MLVLTRRLQEKLMIGENIVVQVLRVKGNQVRLGITAPSEVAILRNELYMRVSTQNPPHEKSPDILFVKTGLEKVD